MLLDALSTNPVLALGVGGSVGILASSLALGLRHGIDWDHIAAILDITSTSGAATRRDEEWLTREPGVMLTDESHHGLAAAADGNGAEHSVRHSHEPVLAAEPVAQGGRGGVGVLTMARPIAPRLTTFAVQQRQPLLLGTLYAVGHGTMVVALGLLAILASEFLPSWVDPVMERVVGVTLLFLAAYLFYSLYRFFKGDGDFRMRSRWMLVFAATRNAYGRATAWFHGHEHHHVQPGEQYGERTAYTIGLVHGIGAETGTQVLVIATAVGAGSKTMGVAALLAFVVGLLISNSIITVTSSAGFVSARRRRALYIVAGLLAAVFSLVLGVLFLVEAGGVLPDLSPITRWIGGPSV